MTLVLHQYLEHFGVLWRKYLEDSKETSDQKDKECLTQIWLRLHHFIAA